MFPQLATNPGRITPVRSGRPSLIRATRHESANTCYCLAEPWISKWSPPSSAPTLGFFRLTVFPYLGKLVDCSWSVIIEQWSEGDSHILWFCEDRRLMGARIRVRHPRVRYPANRVYAIIKIWTAENSCITHSGDDGRAAAQPKAEYGTGPSP